jgi:lipopolysaccharide transport system ATP-binding protein
VDTHYAIRIEHVGKRYRIGSRRQKYRTLRETVAAAVQAPFRPLVRRFRGRPAPPRTDTLWALNDVSLSIRPGEVVGLIGRNGAGKTTLLKVLSRITEPTRGRVRFRGRIGSLLEVGTGFHPELTGRENIYLNGAILGMRRAEIDRKFDEIVAFADTEAFLDTPVKHYSSGMHVRLAFAVAAHLEPEILLIDEVLAVGDVSFQQKCLGKMGAVARAGRTVIFVSHNMAAVSSLCSRAVLLTSGRVAADGSVGDVMHRYLAETQRAITVPLAQRNDRQGDGRLRFSGLTYLDERGRSVATAVSGKPLTVALDYATSDGRPVREVDVDVAFYGVMGQLLFVCKAQWSRGRFATLPGQGRIHCHISRFPLSPAIYRVKLWSDVNRLLADRLEDAGTLVVEAGDFFGTGRLPEKNPEGIVLVEHTWHVVQQHDCAKPLRTPDVELVAEPRA